MFQSLQEITETCESTHKEFWEVVLEDSLSDSDGDRAASLEKMHRTLDAMLEAAASYDGSLRSASGLAGGDGAAMQDYISRSEPLCGRFLGEVITGALQMGESNACMKRIVAAPTAGSCGVMPAVLVPWFQRHPEKDAMIKAMYVAAGIGQVIALRASISGAAGGCQAEIGSASAMTAGALVSLMGGSPRQIINASAMSLKNLLGLVCDPVAGLVEVPCIKRNVIGAVNAVSCAEMSMAGITSRIPPDEVIDAMKEIGDKMHESLRETAKGGLAATPEARKLYAGTAE